MNPLCCGCGRVRGGFTRFATLDGLNTWQVCNSCVNGFKATDGYTFDGLLTMRDAAILVSLVNSERREHGKEPLPIPYPVTALHVATLAREFSAVLKRWLSADDWAALLVATKALKDDSICHSHDYCDANVAMDEAFRVVTGRACVLPCDVAEDSAAEVSQLDADNALWNAAWTMAKAQGFFAAEGTVAA